jgi:hypothetical protein
MNELLALIRKSKTAKSGLVTIVWGILLLFGVGGVKPPATIDEMANKPDDIIVKLLGLGALATGGTTLKGRNDVEKKVKELENNG